MKRINILLNMKRKKLNYARVVSVLCLIPFPRVGGTQVRVREFSPLKIETRVVEEIFLITSLSY